MKIAEVMLWLAVACMCIGGALLVLSALGRFRFRRLTDLGLGFLTGGVVGLIFTGAIWVIGQTG